MNKIKEWDSILEAAKFYDIDRMAISNCVKNRTKSSVGFIWKFKNETNGSGN